jgi:succinate dehydrogenase/fumarate reductase flavoprotein subunit
MLEAAPSAHTCLGGVNVNGELEAKAGLFVCGEALGGTHGANRLSSNSLSEALVTGYFAGKHAAEKSSRKTSSRFLEPPYLPPDGGSDLAAVRTRLTTLMGECAGVERCGQRIEQGLETLSDLSSEISNAGQFGVTDQKAWYDLRSMIMVARAILISALTRQESRGAHFRADYVDQDDANWNGNIVLSDGAEMRVRYVPITE